MTLYIYMSYIFPVKKFLENFQNFFFRLKIDKKFHKIKYLNAIITPKSVKFFCGPPADIENVTKL